MPKVFLGSDIFDDYENKEGIYVDKSLFIRDLIDDENKIMLITRPRRFGKSLNMTMLKSYFEKSHRDKSFLFKSLKIWATGESYRKEQGKYPVIYLTLKDVASLDFEMCLEGLKSQISKTFTQHQKIKVSLNANELKKFDLIESEEGSQKNFEDSLGLLVQWLERYYKEQVIILIDEYDSPINAGYSYGYKDQIISFMRNFLGAAMKSNPSLKKAVLTGVTRIAGESLFSGLNNFSSYSVLDDRYSEYFGFTEDETKWVMEACEVKHDFSEIKDWFDGYTFGKTKDMYNPWAIMNVAHSPEKMIQSYWINSGSDTMIRDHLAKATIKTKEIFYAMIQGEKIRLPVVDNITYDDLIKGTSGLWSFLLYAGYLTAEDPILFEDLPTAMFFIPNKEVRYAMKRLISGWVSRQPGAPENTVETMLTFMLLGDFEYFEDKLQSFILKSFSYFDATGNEPELVYHAFILGLLAHLSKDYYFNSNPEAGIGRADILIMPKVGTYANIGVILEFKKARKPEDLELKAVEALAQIKTKGYEDEAMKRGAKMIHAYGISFYKQEVKVILETVAIK